MNSATMKSNKTIAKGSLKGSIHTVHDDIVALITSKSKHSKRNPKRKIEDNYDTTPETCKKPKAGANGDKPSWIRHLKPLSGTKYKVGDTK